MDITALAAIKGLDGLLLRQTVTANNIANANSEGFAPSGVSFESALRKAIERGDAQSVRQSPLLQFVKAPLGDPSAARVRLDQEVASLSETTLNYQLLVTLLERKLSTAKLAYGDGRGQ